MRRVPAARPRPQRLTAAARGGRHATQQTFTEGDPPVPKLMHISDARDRLGDTIASLLHFHAGDETKVLEELGAALTAGRSSHYEAETAGGEDRAVDVIDLDLDPPARRATAGASSTRPRSSRSAPTPTA
jgi:hypothetical protein